MINEIFYTVIILYSDECRAAAREVSSLRYFIAYTRALTAAALDKRSLSAEIDISVEPDTVRRLSSPAVCIKTDAKKPESALVEVRTHPTAVEQASFCRATVFVAMQELRTVVDEAETLVSAKHWPFPTYGELLYGI